jgi:hypothetical protein
MVLVVDVMRGPMKPLKFIVLPPTFNLHRLQPGMSIPKAVFASSFYSISQTSEELSVVAPDTVSIDAQKTEPGWRALMVVGPLDFALTGILADIAGALAKAGISIFAISTFDTDIILVKNEHLKEAKAALLASGHKFARATPAPQAEKEENFLQQGYRTLLEKQIPLIRSLFVDKIGPGALATLRSETSLAVVAGGLYEFLPMPVRLVANREAFVSFCVGNLDKILPDAQVSQLKPGPNSAVKPASKAKARKTE